MKNKLKFSAIFTLLIVSFVNAQVGIGTTTPNASAVLDVSSTTKGLLLPRLTTLERTEIANPAAGLQVYDTDTKNNWFYNGTTWSAVGVVTTITGSNGVTVEANNVKLGGTLTEATTITQGTNNLSFTGNIGVGGNVGIGTITPAAKLDVNGYIKVGTSDVVGDTAPTPGMIRFNTTTSKFQGFVGGVNPGWIDLN